MWDFEGNFVWRRSNQEPVDFLAGLQPSLAPHKVAVDNEIRFVVWAVRHRE
jgi:hypothetical protein